MDNIINVEHVSKNFSGHQALDDVSLDIPRGKVYGLLGPNGAGKTTLIRIINHITVPDSGLVKIDSHPLTQDDVLAMGYLPEERGLYKKMKVGDQALFFARLKGLSKAEAKRRLVEWFERFDIIDWWDRKVEELSKGMAQKIQFIVTVLHEPRLLIFDEPFSGFDPINANLLKEEILRLRDQGATIIFSTHNMASVEEICDNITLINRGRNVLSGNVAELRSRFSDGRYTISFEGSLPKAAGETLARAASVTVVPATDGEEKTPTGVTTLDLRLHADATVRDVIEILNPAVELRSLNRSIASMNDIFITTINTSNPSAPNV